jgi:hypothetical protein
MVDLADVCRRFAHDHVARHGTGMLPSHRRAIADIIACRSAALGGHLWRCEACRAELYAYHSCGNRSCPRCHRKQTERWLAARTAELLDAPYFHITVTVPAELRAVLRANQRDGYALLMKAAAGAIIELARDPRHVGAQVGVLAVLHTWTQQLHYHPHVHCLVTGGGISDDGRFWHPARKGFLVPVKALAKLVRGKLRDALARQRPDLKLPALAWHKPWVVHATTWGTGPQAVLDYLARYLFRVAITNNRVVALDDEAVTVRYKQRKANRLRTCRIEGGEFMRRFLSHVLPKGLHKVRYFGLWHPSRRALVQQARLLLARERRADPLPEPSPDPQPGPPAAELEPRHLLCPCCRQGRLVHLRRLGPCHPLGP